MPRIEKMNTRKILEALQRGEIKLSDAEAQLKGYEDLGHSRIDLEREERNGIPEVIYGEGKTTKEIAQMLGSSPSTVESHRKAIAQRLQISGAELIRTAALHQHLQKIE